MKKKNRLCIVSPTYVVSAKNTASQIAKSAIRTKIIGFIPARLALYAAPLILTAILFMTGLMGLGFHVFLDNIYAGVMPVTYTDDMVASLLYSPPKNKVKLYPCFVIGKNYTSENDLSQKLMLIDGQLFEGSAFIRDGKPLFVLENPGAVQEVISEYTKPYKSENTTVTVLDCNSETANGIYKISEKTDKEKALAAIAGIPVITMDSISTKEPVAHTTQTLEDSTKKEGTLTVTNEGVDGEMSIKKVVRKVNGEVTSERVVDQTVVVVPVARIEALGTKVISGTGTGAFIKPVSGAISSNYGQRWGKNHNGTDFIGDVGDPIEAADAGTVSFTGTAEGFGNLVIIDHKNGFETYYGHLNKSYVAEGDKVESGEIIGEIGSTGNSTGPHLHFEIRKNKIPIDPLNLIQ